METVELRAAFEWTCPECGRDFFTRAITFEGSEEDKKELDDVLEINGIFNKDGSWLRVPDFVKCPSCDLDFPTDGPE